MFLSRALRAVPVCAALMLVACGARAPSPTASPIAPATASPTAQAVATLSPTALPAAATVSPSATPIPPSATIAPAATPTRPAPTATPTRAPTATPTRAPTPTRVPDRIDGLRVVTPDQLPREARDTLALIARGGPFPFDRDGIVFENREGLLPRKARGYYREYTVITPNSRDRGARRIIAGQGGERYYTADHYESFVRVIVR